MHSLFGLLNVCACDVPTKMTALGRHMKTLQMLIKNPLFFRIVKVIVCPFSHVQSKADVITGAKMASDQKEGRGTF